MNKKKVKKIGVLGFKGFVGNAISNELKKKKIPFIGLTKLNQKKNINKNFDYLINCAQPSKRYWAKKNPLLDYDETVNKAEYLISNFKFSKFIHLSSISARCQKKTVYGNNRYKSEQIVKKCSNHLIIRLGPMFNKSLNKGVLIDLLSSKTVFVNKKSKYSFTNLKWIANWIIKNFIKKNGLIELGAKDFIILEDVAKYLKSKSKFYGKIDNQLIKSKNKYDCSSKEVFNFLNKC